MSGRFFLDTNVLVYSFDDTAPAKRDRARALIADALEGQGLISYQVVQEFLNVALRKFAQPMTATQATTYLDGVLAPLCALQSSVPLYHDALAVRLRWGFSFYDALIVASARRAGCSTLYSEDLQHGQDLDGLVVVDPFRGA